MRYLQLLHHLEIDGENAEIATSRAPRRRVSDQILFGVFRAVSEFDFFDFDVISLGDHGCPCQNQAGASAGSADCLILSFMPVRISRTLNGRPSVLLMPRIFSLQNLARKGAASWPGPYNR